MIKAETGALMLHYDFEVCIGVGELKRAIASLNYNGYELVAVTQTMDKYTVFFRRPVA